METEKRVFDSSLEIETRAEGDEEKRVLVGYAAVFNKRSEEMWGFTEKIANGAFDDVLKDDVRALFNHDPNHVLGRTTAKTLRITQDNKGLRYEVDLPNTEFANGLRESIRRGDINQSSFAFRVGDQTWEEKEDETIRTITRVERLIDVSPVTYPAYPDATVATRSLNDWKEERDKETAKSIDIKQKELDLVNLELSEDGEE